MGRLLHLGQSGWVVRGRVLVLTDPESAPLKRLIRQAQDQSTRLDLTYGQGRRSLLVLDTGHVVLASEEPSELARRWETGAEEVQRT